MGGKFKTKSISTDALFERQIAEVDDAFSSNGRSFFHGCSDEIRTVFGWFHAFIFGGESLEQFTKAMQSISTVKSCQFPLPSAGAGALKIGPKRVDSLGDEQAERPARFSHQKRVRLTGPVVLEAATWGFSFEANRSHYLRLGAA